MDYSNTSDTNSSVYFDGDDVLFGNNTTDAYGERDYDEPSLPVLYSVLIWMVLAFTCFGWRLYVEYSHPERSTRDAWLKYFKESGSQMKVKKGNIQGTAATKETDKETDVESAAGGEEEPEDKSFLVLDTRVLSNDENPKVPNSCAICMDSYHEGQTVVWSYNSECHHVFHRHCFVDYLLNHHGDETPCPICRRDFCRPGAVAQVTTVPFSEIPATLVF